MFVFPDSNFVKIGNFNFMEQAFNIQAYFSSILNTILY